MQYLCDLAHALQEAFSTQPAGQFITFSDVVNVTFESAYNLLPIYMLVKLIVFELLPDK